MKTYLNFTNRFYVAKTTNERERERERENRK
jgi:hypothetical protein